MVHLRPYQTVRYFDEPCIVIEIYDSKVILQSIENPDVKYPVNVTSRFIEVEDGLTKYVKRTALVTR